MFTSFLISTLGQAEYGIYQLVISITAYLALLDLGVGNSVIRYIAKYRANNDKQAQRRFLGITTIYYAIIAVIVLIVGGIILHNFSSIFAKGLTDSEITELRRKLRDADSSYKVYKNTLTKRAFDKLSIKLDDCLEGPSALATSDDAIAPIKVLADFAKEHPTLELKGGIVDGKETTLEELKELSTLKGYSGLIICSENNGMGFTAREYKHYE